MEVKKSMEGKTAEETSCLFFLFLTDLRGKT